MITPWQRSPSLQRATAEVFSITSIRSCSRRELREPLGDPAAGRGSPGVHDPPAGMAALQSERQALVGIEVEPGRRAAGAPRRRPAPRAASSSAADRRHAPRPAAIVSSTCCSGESSGPIAAASPPCAQKLELSLSGFRDTIATREPASAAVSAE